MFPIKKKKRRQLIYKTFGICVYIYIYIFICSKEIVFFPIFGLLLFLFFNFVGQLDLNKRLFDMEW